MSAVDEYEIRKHEMTLQEMSRADAAIAEMGAEIERLKARLAYLTVDCDEYVFKGGRCYQYELDTICPREPRCHDKDRWAEGMTP